MSFSEFINAIITSFNTVFNYIITYFNLLVSNNFIKLIIYTTLFFLLIEFMFKIYDFIKNIFSMKKKAKDNKVASNTDVE